jgi:hypothetical protein
MRGEPLNRIVKGGKGVSAGELSPDGAETGGRCAVAVGKREEKVRLENIECIWS